MLAVHIIVTPLINHSPTHTPTHYTRIKFAVQYKLVFMDNLMPHMNGLQSSASMRQAGFPYIIAGVTGYVRTVTACAHVCHPRGNVHE